MWHSVTLSFPLTLVSIWRWHSKLKLILWNNSGGIEAISQFILRGLLHVIANPMWGVWPASESSVFGSFCVPSRPVPQNTDLASTHLTLHPLWNVYICSVTMSFFLKGSFFSLTFKGIKRYSMLRFRLNPHPCLISCATVSIKHERDATRSGWAEFYQCKSPQLLL